VSKVFGVEVYPGARYRARMLIHHSKWLAGEGTIRSKLEGAGFTDINFYSPGSLPADWPAGQSQNIDDDWTAFLEGTFNGGDIKEPPASTSDYDMLGFWLYSGGPKALTDGSAPVQQDASMLVQYKFKPSPVKNYVLAASGVAIATGFWMMRKNKRRAF
jgi:hypothetical protein